jgi:hypothetical protein
MAYTTIKKPSDYFNTLLYSGNNTAQRQLTGVGFQPDLVWIKGRSGTYGAYSHFVFDGVRGVGKQIFTNNTNAESTNLDNLYSFDSDGFSLGQSGVDGVTNGSSTEFVSWNWLASNTTASNTDGTVTSTVSANTTSGFSIVSYTGTGSAATVGHGLGVAPKIVLTKNRDTADNWLMYHASTGNTKALYLNENFVPGTSSAYWNNTSPTNSVFSVGTEVPMNKSGDSIIAYCFSEVKGFSKFGSYTGNGSTDGTFVYTGFKPAFLITKKSSAAGDSWNLLDATRNPNNAVDKRLTPDTSDAEATTTQYDFLSNGFKVRASTGAVNTSGATYIYMAFAENPLVGTNNIPATAR